MKYHLFLTAAILLSAAASHAQPFCKLNIRGDSICIGDQVIMEMAVEKEMKNKKADERLFEVVEIEDIKYPKVIIRIKKQMIETSIDNVIGKQQCSDGDHVCKKDKVKLLETCKTEGKDQARIANVFTNEMIQIDIKRIPIIGKTETFVLPVNCVDEVIENN